MEQSDRQLPSGRSSSTSVNTSKKSGSALGIPPGFDGYRRSNDANLFSCSLPVLPHGKLNFTDSKNGVRAIGDVPCKLNNFGEDAEGKNPIEDLDIDGIGSLLPNEDELLAGIMDDFDLSALSNQLDELEECDIFGSGGGMELDFDLAESLSIGMGKADNDDGYVGTGPNGIVQYSVPNGAGTIAGEHPYGEHPSRTLFVRNINSNVEDSELQSLFEQYGDIRTLYTACKHRGFVMISYYDIRAARTVMRALQNKPLRRRKLDIHFSIPKDNPSEKDINQGTLVVFNLDPSVSNDDLLQIFGAYGEVKEIRETPHKRHHKFIEYYDVRAAEAALRSLNRSDIAGKRIKLEPSRPGGARRNMMQHLSQELEHDETRSYRQQMGSPIISSPPGTWTHVGSPNDNIPLRAFNQSPNFKASSPILGNHLSGLASILPLRVSSSAKIAPIGKEQSRINSEERVFSNSPTNGVPFQSTRSFPERSNVMVSNNGILPNMNSSPGTSFIPTSGGSDIGTLTGNQFLWGSPKPYPEHTQSSAWPTSSMGHSFISNGHGQGFPYSNHGSFFPSSHHHVGSAPSGMPIERHFGYFSESPEVPFMSPAFGSMGSIGRNEGILSMSMGVRGPMSPGIALRGDISDNGSPAFRAMSSQRSGNMFLGNSPFAGPGASGIEGLNERSRSRGVDNTGLDSKKQYQLDLEKIVSGEDTRTTLMIKNIPNKYTSKMLLAAIDEKHKGTYDFVYLPIDFKNKCNVGYAFINMLSPSHIISFYEAFNGKKWEKFNSEKVASLAYARIQGLDSLIAHFQNSSLMNEDKRCRPIIFNSDGLATADQGPYPQNGTVICEHQRDRGSLRTSHESPENCLSGNGSGWPYLRE